MTVQVVSLGCRLNMSESEEMRAMLASADDMVVVNSCAVTAEAVRQTRQTIRRLRRNNPDARLLVTGCAAEVEREMIAAMPEVDGLVPNDAKLDPRHWNVAVPFARPRARFTRAFVQVQNGCDHSCTFCIIPMGRGKSRSLEIPAVLREIGRHVEAGIREVVLTGVDLTSWGHDLDGSPPLGRLISHILEAFPELPRLRLSSIDGAEVDPELFDLLAFEPRMMPHVHLSLQSGDDLTLKRMKRRHTRRDAVELVARLRESRPDLGLGADLIAGFPTESEEMHARNLSVIDELGIVHGHVFPFSPRPGTPAAHMPQVDPIRIKSRAAELREAVARQRGAWLEGQKGRTLRVLAEADGTGHAENFAPVRLPDGYLRGGIVTITPQRLTDGILE